MLIAQAQPAHVQGLNQNRKKLSAFFFVVLSMILLILCHDTAVMFRMKAIRNSVEEVAMEVVDATLVGSVGSDPSDLRDYIRDSLRGTIPTEYGMVIATVIATVTATVIYACNLLICMLFFRYVLMEAETLVNAVGSLVHGMFLISHVLWKASCKLASAVMFPIANGLSKVIRKLVMDVLFPIALSIALSIAHSIAHTTVKMAVHMVKMAVHVLEYVLALVEPHI